MTSDLNGLTPFYNISTDGKNRLKQETMPTIPLMLDPIYLFHGKLMRDFKYQFILSKKLVSTFCTMELNSFYLKDFVKMILKLILEDNVQLVLAKIIHRSKMPAIMITTSSHSCQYHIAGNVIDESHLPKRKKLQQSFKDQVPGMDFSNCQNGFFLKPHINKKYYFGISF